MNRHSIGDFTLTRISTGDTFKVTVPGSVLQTLQSNGVIPDPFVDDNEKKALEVMEEEFEFAASFDCEKELFDSKKKEIVFEGIDTLADVYLNGQKIFFANNMHRTYRCDVTDVITEKDNELKLHFYSPTKYIREAFEKVPCDGTEDAMEGFVHLRKAHYMFGWDWGPRVPDAGLFRNVTLEGIDVARIQNVRIHQEHYDGKVEITPVIQEEIIEEGAKALYEVRIVDPAGKECCFLEGEAGEKLTISNPKLWWPNGFGEQNLYTIEIKQKVNGHVTDSVTKRIGLRTLTITRNKDQWGESFSHCVNGVDVFAMGADYIPEDNYLDRITPERTRKLLEDCKAVNFNSIRIWGGGFFPSDEFYVYCDEMGFMVWQDLMFACGVYDLSDEFEESIHAEICDNLKRIADHPCLALVCGNNEMEQFVKYGVWVRTHKQKADYIKMFEYLFPKWVKEYAPDAVYWPSSPSSGGSFDDPADEKRGDVHYWSVWHESKPFTEYRKHFFRYLSEFGFQALPSVKTMEQVIADKSQMNLFSYSMEKHQRNKSANAKIMQYMQATFRYPTDFETLTYASQLLSAEAIRYGVEHFRRNRGICMGTIYWQLNDCWPVISWASVDYYGRWKALHYFAKKFFAPVLLSCQETSMVSEGIEINSEKTAFIPAIMLNVSNETMTARNMKVEWELRDASGNVVETDDDTLKTSEILDVNVPALSAVWLDKKEFNDIDIYSNYVSYRAIENGEIISAGSVLFAPPKYFKFENPKLTVTKISDSEIKVEAKAFAKNVEIQNTNDDLVLEDNFFDMNPGSRVIKVLRGELSDLKVRSVADI